MVSGVSMTSKHQVRSSLTAIVPFKVAFEGRTDFPVIQVSLPGDGSPESAAKLGKALASLR